MKEKNSSPLKKAWDVFSLIGGVIGTASMVEGIVSWVGFIDQLIIGYQQLIRPLLSWIPEIFNFPVWISDYIFVGTLVVGARIRPTVNNMKGRWLIGEDYKWYEIWAPHKVAVFFASILAICLWPIFSLLYYPFKKNNEFQKKIYKEQYQWLAIYLLCLVCLVIVNGALTKLSLTSG